MRKKLGEVPVWITLRSDRNVWVLRYPDPQTGKRRQVTLPDAYTEADAYIAAGELKAKLNSPLPVDIQTGEAWTWDAFCKRYKTEYLSSTSNANQGKWKTVVAMADEVFADRGVSTPLLSMIDVEFIDAVAMKLKTKRKNKPATVASAIATFRSGLSLAASKGWMKPVPATPSRGRKAEESAEMRGRPLTTEEFERLLLHSKKYGKTAGHYKSWQILLKGLWLGGLRISEAMDLHRTSLAHHRPVDLFSKRPKILFLSSQKNRKDQMVAITPDFAKFLRELHDRGEGHYFTPTGQRGVYKTHKAVGRVISGLAESAKVRISPTEFASAHDLRRSFARRWSTKVMPPTLKHLMRHQSIETTLKFYVGSDADVAAVSIREAWESGEHSSQIICEDVAEQLVETL